MVTYAIVIQFKLFLASLVSASLVQVLIRIIGIRAPPRTNTNAKHGKLRNFWCVSHHAGRSSIGNSGVCSVFGVPSMRFLGSVGRTCGDLGGARFRLLCNRASFSAGVFWQIGIGRSHCVWKLWRVVLRPSINSDISCSFNVHPAWICNTGVAQLIAPLRACRKHAAPGLGLIFPREGPLPYGRLSIFFQTLGFWCLACIHFRRKVVFLVCVST